MNFARDTKRPGPSVLPLALMGAVMLGLGLQVWGPRQDGAGPTFAGDVLVLDVSAEGDIQLGDLRGTAALVEIGARRASSAYLISADPALPATELARVLDRLARLGVTEFRLVMGGSG